MQEIFKIKDLGQVKLLSDPLKLKLLKAFAESEKTTKQVASELGENVTKLYRHVDALHGAGLLEIADEKQKRGTVERTFRAVAQRFEADHGLFAEDEAEEGTEAVREMLRVLENEIVRALANEGESEDPKAILTRLHLNASPERIAKLADALRDWIEMAQEETDESTDKSQEFGAFIGFYPVD